MKDNFSVKFGSVVHREVFTVCPSPRTSYKELANVSWTNSMTFMLAGSLIDLTYNKPLKNGTEAECDRNSCPFFKNTSDMKICQDFWLTQHSAYSSTNILKVVKYLNSDDNCASKKIRNQKR